MKATVPTLCGGVCSKVSEKFQNGLSGTIKKQLEEVDDKNKYGKEAKKVTETEPAVLKSIPLSKLDEMTKKLASGYTSFWS